MQKIKSYENAYLMKYGRINILYLKGSAYARGLQHGKLLADEIKNGALAFFSSLPNKIIDHACLHHKQYIKTLLKKIVYEFVTKSFIKNLSEDDLKTCKGISTGSLLDYNEILKAFVSPDIYSYLGGKAFKYMRRQLSSTLGCSSFIVWGAYTKDRKFYHARNLDFPGIGFWDKYPTITINTPDDGIPYVAVTTAGGELNVTSMNKEGLTIDVHFLYAHDVSRKCRPLVSIMNEIIKRAKNIEEAISIIKKYTRSGGWAIILSSAKDQKACVVECTAHNINIVEPSKSSLYYTNFFETTAFKKYEYIPSGGIYEHNSSRYERLKNLIDTNKGEIDHKLCIQFLSDHFDPYSQSERSFGNTITSIFNITSCVFSSMDGDFYVAESEAPVSNSARFIKFNLHDLLAENFDNIESVNNINTLEKFPGTEDYIKAHKAWFDDFQITPAIQNLENAIAKEPKEALYLFSLGFFLLKENRIDEAINILKKSLAHEKSEYKINLNKLWIARAYDLKNDRINAHAYYKEVKFIATDCGNLHKLANTGLKKSFTQKNLTKKDLLTFIADVIE
jgi:tetratricopeptide (TPR) repeat protein